MQVIENTFGILASHWRIFQQPIVAEPETVVFYTKVAIALRTRESSIYCPLGFTDGEDGAGNVAPGRWRDDDQLTSLNLVSCVSSNRFV